MIHPLPLISARSAIENKRLGNHLAFKETFSEGKGGVKVYYSSDGVFLKEG